MSLSYSWNEKCLTKKVVEKIKTHILYSFFFFENRAVYKTMPKNSAESEAPQTIWRMRITSCIPKATNTCPQYVILTAFPLHQLRQCNVVHTLPLLFKSLRRGQVSHLYKLPS
jgi:hypothetical protein